MSLVDDGIEVVKFGFSWTSRKELWKWLVAVFLVYVLLNLVSPTTPEQGLNLVNIALALVAIVLLLVVSYLVQRASLEVKGYKLRENSPLTFVNFVVVNILIGLAAMFSAFDLKLLALPLLAIILAVAIPGEVAVMILAAVVGLIYLVIVIRNFFRLLAADGLFLEGKQILESLSLSWKATPRMALKIFILNLPLSIVAGLISTVGSLLALAFGTEQIIAGAIASALFASVAFTTSTFSFGAVYQWIMGGKATTAPAQSAAMPTVMEVTKPSKAKAAKKKAKK